MLQKRQDEKTSLLKTMKKVRKGSRMIFLNINLDIFFDLGKKGGMEELEESLGDRQRNGKKNRKMEYKNKKFGFGGQKKNSKQNTAESSADVFNRKSSKWQRPSFHAQKGKKVGGNFSYYLD